MATQISIYHCDVIRNVFYTIFIEKPHSKQMHVCTILKSDHFDHAHTK